MTGDLNTDFWDPTREHDEPEAKPVIQPIWYTSRTNNATFEPVADASCLVAKIQIPIGWHLEAHSDGVIYKSLWGRYLSADQVLGAARREVYGFKILDISPKASVANEED
jgi:hypothetical protein